jgi:hypothetical protein
LLIIAMLLPAFGTAATYRYHVAVGPTLDRLSVRAIVGEVRALRARDGRAADMSNLAACNGDVGVVVGHRIEIPAGVDCVRYDYSLAAASEAATRPMRRPEVANGIAVTSPSQWLWLPSLRDNDQVLITLELQPNMRASVPWALLSDGTYALPASPRSSRGVAIFGDFRLDTVAVAGANLRVALVNAPGLSLTAEPNSTKVLAWLEAAARDVAGVSGKFPNPAPQVIVQPGPAVPWGGGRSPVPFGYVIRDGGEAVRFFVAAGRSLDDFLEDWTATHEFSHLLLPYVRSQEKWISEGFASYYQNVLLARRGVYTEREAWQRLHGSFLRAAQISDPPRLGDLDQRPFWEMRMLIYWGGAAVALLADTKLRHVSGGRDSLDAVLGRLQNCCLPSARVWRGRELFAKLDELSTQPLFVEIFDRHTTARGLPNLTSLYADLGIEIDSGDKTKISLDGDAPMAQIRRDIMTR